MSDFLQGATMLGSLAIALFFLKFWRQTGDRFFAAFAAAFTVFAANRLFLVLLDEGSEARTWVYALRALAFILIIVAIVDKNYSNRRV